MINRFLTERHISSIQRQSLKADSLIFNFEAINNNCLISLWRLIVITHRCDWSVKWTISWLFPLSKWLRGLWCYYAYHPSYKKDVHKWDELIIIISAHLSPNPSLKQIYEFSPRKMKLCPSLRLYINNHIAIASKIYW